MKKKHKNSKKKRKKRLKMLISVFIIIIMYLFVDNYFSHAVQLFTNQKAQQFTTRAVEDAVRTSIVNTNDVDNLLNITYKSDGYVSGVSVNTKKVNALIANMSKELYDTVSDLENSRNKELRVNLGYLVSRSFFTNFGPVISINLKPIGSVRVDCVSSVSPNGINNSLLEVYIKVSIDFLVLIPLQSQKIATVTNVPVAVEILQGNIPQFHYQGSSTYIPPVTISQ